LPPPDDESVYIKDRKIGELEYGYLAAFFGEDTVDQGLWKNVLQQVAQSEDTGVRRMVLAIVLDDPHTHAQYRGQDEIYYRAKKLIHAVKRRTGRAPGWRGQAVGAALFFRHFIVSKELILFLLLICLIIAFFVYIRYGRTRPGLF
jgi:hypothetical protein